MDVMVPFRGSVIINKGTKLNKAAKSAFRFSITQQIERYRSLYFKYNKNATCEATGLKLIRKDTQVDHIIHFSKLLQDFIKLYKVKDIELIYMGKYKTYALVDYDLDILWQQYHQKFAKLRCVIKEFNLKRSRTWKSNQEEIDEDLIKQILLLRKNE